MLRSLAGFGLPLFAPYVYQSLGLEWGNSLLDFLAIGRGIPTSLLLWKYGETLNTVGTVVAKRQTNLTGVRPCESQPPQQPTYDQQIFLVQLESRIVFLIDGLR